MRAIAALQRIVPAVLVALAASSLATEAKAANVALAAILVEPASPGPGALCRLKVRLKNGGTQTASLFAFSVTINGEEVSTYKAHTFANSIGADATGEIDLHNFWTPSAPKAFDVRITLTEAQWVQVKKEGTTTTTAPAGPVPGLPTSATLTVKMSPGK